MNRARANPAAEGAFLAASGDHGIVNGINFFRVNLTTLQSEFNALTAKPPGAFDRRLYEASKAHSEYLMADDVQDHTGQFGRITSAGFTFTAASVSVYSYAATALQAHGALNIDWGSGTADGVQIGRGHRAAIMSSSSSFWSNVGFAILPDNDFNTGVGPLVFSGAYCVANARTANHHNRFLVGTVWTDANNNNRYDPGEGRDKVIVQPDAGSFHAITGVAGGWSIPITSPGNFTLTFSGGGLSPFTRTATVAADSVLVDTKVTSSATATLVLKIRRALPGPGYVLEWSGGTPPYQLRSSPNLEAGSWINVGSPTSTTIATVNPTVPHLFYHVTGSP